LCCAASPAATAHDEALDAIEREWLRRRRQSLRPESGHRVIR
jgi:hypothetical protein